MAKHLIFSVTSAWRPSKRPLRAARRSGWMQRGVALPLGAGPGVWFRLDQRGASAVEYMLIIAVVVVVMASALTVLHDALAHYFTDLTSWVGCPYP